MTKPNAEIVYVVHYQSENRPDWFVLEQAAYDHPAPHGLHAATYDFGEADDVATSLLRNIPIPLKPNRKPVTGVNAVRVVQEIHMGGEMVRYGTAHPDTDPDD